MKTITPGIRHDSENTYLLVETGLIIILPVACTANLDLW